MLIVIGALLGGALVLAAMLLFAHPGRVERFKGSDGKPLEGSVSEKTWINIGGFRQEMFIRGKDTANPVLLFLHGGPGMPEYFLAESTDTGLEGRFTVCYWEQRGSGLSYESGMDARNVLCRIL